MSMHTLSKYTMRPEPTTDPVRQAQLAFLSAVERTDLSAVRSYLDRGVDANSREANGETALLIASRCEDEDASDGLEIVRLLLDRGADYEGVDSHGWTPLRVAAGCGLLEIVRMLLVAGASHEAVDHFGVTALMSASTWGTRDVVNLLLDRGADINARDIYGYTALIHLASVEDVEVTRLRWLLDRGASVNIMNNSGMTALCCAAAHGSIDSVRILLEHGALLDVNPDSLTPLGWARGYERTEIAELIENFDAD
jgi:ankyrin repeat protein